MNKSAKHWLAGAFVVGFLAVGVPYWPIPYNKVSLPNTLFGIGLLVVCLAAAAARAFAKTHWLLTIIIAGRQYQPWSSCESLWRQTVIPPHIIFGL